ncbi:MAG: 6-phosphofructokinase, partial [Janthinobacterium lividum]
GAARPGHRRHRLPATGSPGWSGWSRAGAAHARDGARHQRPGRHRPRHLAGAQDPEAMVDTLVARGIDLLFVIGGDGSMRGAAGIAAALRPSDLPVGVVGIPKTIDNDIPSIGQSFGFTTAFSAAARSIDAAMVEARAADPGLGLVKLMGRHAGFIACYAALANLEADVVLIPEVPFAPEGENDLFATVRRRVAAHGSAVVVVAEGAGQDILAATGTTDASGIARLGDIGLHLEAALVGHFAGSGEPLTLEYIDPGYLVRSGPGRPARRRLLPAARPDRRARRHGRAYGRGGRAPPQPVHPRADLGRGLGVPPRRHRRRPVAERARVDGAAAVDGLRPVPRARLTTRAEGSGRRRSNEGSTGAGSHAEGW